MPSGSFLLSLLGYQKLLAKALRLVEFPKAADIRPQVCAFSARLSFLPSPMESETWEKYSSAISLSMALSPGSSRLMFSTAPLLALVTTMPWPHSEVSGSQAASLWFSTISALWNACSGRWKAISASARC
ncbi:hypothetical protein D3C80_1856760 [compost metagenome]